MAFNNNTMLRTLAGQVLVANASAGGQIKFLRMELGSGYPLNDDAARQMTALANEQLTVAISSIDVLGTNVVVRGYYLPSDVTTAFTMTEIGLIAEDAGGSPVLFAYVYDATSTAVVSDESDYAQVQLKITFSVNDADITFTPISPEGLASFDDLNNMMSAHEENANPHGITNETIGADPAGAAAAVQANLNAHAGQKNPHNAAASDIGADPAGAAAAAQANLNTHAGQKNPHGAAASDIGADPAGAAAAVYDAFNTHAGQRNPHNTTYSDVGAAPLSHTHSPQTDITGNAATATKLKYSRTIGLSGGVTGAATSFDGSGNITINVTLLNPDNMSKAVPIIKGGTGGTTKAQIAQNIGYLSEFVKYAETAPTCVNGMLWLKPIE